MNRLTRELRRSGMKMKQWYNEVYLNSDHWRQLRQKAIDKAKGRCSKCRTKLCLQVHHIHYRQIYDVKVSDLQVVCKTCHYGHHDGTVNLDKKSTPQEVIKELRRRISELETRVLKLERR